MSETFGRKFRERYQEPEEDRVHLGYVALVFIGFSFLYLATGFFFNASTNTVERTVSTANPYGPITTSKKDTLVEITLRNRQVRQSWNNVEVEVLDSGQRSITAFGGEFFHESGYDWTESERTRSVKVVLPKPGNYYLKFNATGASAHARTVKDLTDSTYLDVSIEYKRGGSEVLNWLGIIILIIGIILNEIRNQSILTMIGKWADRD